MSLTENVAVGLSVDAHQLKAGGPLILGGIEIDFDMHMVGHSDGDALMHAVMDAVLSAADLPDLGELFPGTDENKDRSSVDMAQEVARQLKVVGCRVLSIDSVVLAEAPRISPLREKLRESIASCFDIPVSRVNVKGKTFDHMGPIGNREGIEARAVALVERGITA
jgi:2-C-methyl-D-erythritol 2,4-cyclodiphosphate synthase